MNLLEEKILKYGKVLPGEILKVDNFLNHQVDMDTMYWIGEEFAKRFKDAGITKVLTLESSGIPPAVMTAYELQIPFVFAKKAKSANLGNAGVYTSKVRSYTYGNEYTITVSDQYLGKKDTVLIVDDFLATGEAVHGMLELCEKAGAKVAGIGICIEKGFQNGGKDLREKGYHLESLAVIDEINDDGTLKFRNQGE
ncbi:MAG: xanthine phosphoribosyltransferase [Erysipelotrichales bacterium]|nr:xanthine phosphoribosyltransferase [Erysipelotrichales bacterium]